jgi:hypothetical protein
MSYSNDEVKKISSIKPYSNLNYMKTPFLPDKTRSLTIINTNYLIIYRKIISVNGENRANHNKEGHITAV